ncbi:MAG: CaiB/BaiF CoA-transferase family protein [Pseudomonadota bacterium]
MTLGKELTGLTVISLEQAVAAPYCGLLLADAGARVIKIERSSGDFARGYDAGAGGQSAIFAWLNRGKQSVCLDLKDPGDLAHLRAALRVVDVLLSNLAPGAVARMGLGPEALRQINPGLITCAISGYGPTGEAAQKKAYDFLVQAEAGICAVTGTPDSPARVGVSLTDLATGLTAFCGILRALIQRGITGRGSDLDLSMFDVMADWMNMPLLQHRYTGGAPDRSGLTHSFVAPYGAFVCGDGGTVLLSVQSNREFAALSGQVLGQPELARDPRFAENPARHANRDALAAIITAKFSAHTRADVVAMLDAARIANAQLNSVADLSEHSFLRTARAKIGADRIDMASLPLRQGSNDTENVPDLGAHTADFKAEFQKAESP